jgi:spore coat protein U-like protein
MKLRKLGLVAALCAAGILGGANAWAGDTATVAVSAAVVGTCKFNSGGSISFTLDQTSASDATGSVVNPAFWCTKNTSYTVSDDDGLWETGVGARRMKSTTLGTPEYIPYAFGYTTTGTGAGKTTPITLTLTGATVLNANFVNVSADTYGDTVTLTVAP